MDSEYMYEMAADECVSLAQSACEIIGRHGFTMVEEAFDRMGYRLEAKAPAPVTPARPWDGRIPF